MDNGTRRVRPLGQPPKFPGITKRAAYAIQHLMSTLPEEMKKANYLPAIGWEVGFGEPGFVPRPGLGGMERDRVPPEYVIHAWGVDFMFSFSEATLQKFENSVLDFIDGRFIFVDKIAAQFMGSDPDDHQN
jgi:hypothetical protein